MSVRAVVALAALLSPSLYLVGCDSAGSDPSSPAGEPVEVGPEGLQLVTPQGLGFAVLEGTLTETLEVSLRQLTLATDGTDLPDVPAGVRAVSDPYEVRASQDVHLGSRQAFILGLPVPDEASGEDLAGAVLVPGEATLDVTPSSEAEWHVLPGTYDAEAGMLVMALSSLMREGTTVTLVTNPEGTSPGLRSATGDSGVGWRARCVGFGSFHDLRDDCEGHRADVEAVMDAHLGTFENEGFRAPDVRRLRCDYTGPTCEVGPYDVEIRGKESSRCTGAAGYYVPRTRTLGLCYGGTVGAPEKATLAHELFHGIQHAYLSDAELRTFSRRNLWFIEGMAASTMAYALRDQLEVHGRFSRKRVSESLYAQRDDREGLGSSEELVCPVSNRCEYRAQDFWVYAMRSFGDDVGLLAEILEQIEDAGEEAIGALSYSYATAHALHERDRTGIREMYWAWARNQAFERSNDLGLGGETCTASSGSGWTPPPTGVPVSIEADDPSEVAEQVELPPLSSTWVEVSVPDAGAYAVSIDGEGIDAVRAKYYLEGNDDCASAPEGLEHTVTIQDPDRRVFVLLANTSAFSLDPRTVRLSAEPAEGATMLSDLDLDVHAPAELASGALVNATIAFTTDEPGGVLVWLRPLIGTDRPSFLDGYPASFSFAASKAIEGETATVNRWFAVSVGEEDLTIDGVEVTISSFETREEFLRTVVPTSITFASLASLDTPALSPPGGTVSQGSWVDVDFSFSLDTARDVRVRARPFATNYFDYGDWWSHVSYDEVSYSGTTGAHYSGAFTVHDSVLGAPEVDKLFIEIIDPRRQIPDMQPVYASAIDVSYEFVDLLEAQSRKRAPSSRPVEGAEYCAGALAELPSCGPPGPSSSRQRQGPARHAE